MLDIIICDDSPMQLSTISGKVDSYFSMHNDRTYRVRQYSSPSKLMADLEKDAKCDIAILDILMPESTGIETAKIIKKLRKDSVIIFVSISREYAIDAYDIGAVHYVPKPLTQEDLDKALDRALALREKNSSRQIMLSLKNSAMQSISCTDILYIESVGYRRIVHTKKGEYEEMKKTLSSFMEELNQLMPGQFFVPYRGYIVNLSEISTITPDHIVISDGSRVLIKRGDFRHIRDLYFAWTFGRSED